MTPSLDVASLSPPHACTAYLASLALEHCLTVKVQHCSFFTSNGIHKILTRPRCFPQVRSRALESPGSIFAIASRCAEIVFSLGTYWASLSWDCLLGKSEEQVPYRAQQLRRLLCTLGPSFIKAGQVLANRPDIVREDYMNELCILQDNVPAFPDKVRA
jgi:hypothetical protein